MFINNKKELLRKIGLFGLNDVSRLRPIGDLGYANGWYPQGFFPTQGTYMNGGLERCVYEAAVSQGFKFKCISHNERGTNTIYYCKELELTYHVDSSD